MHIYIRDNLCLYVVMSVRPSIVYACPVCAYVSMILHNSYVHILSEASHCMAMLRGNKRCILCA